MSLRTFNFFQAQPETDVALPGELVDAIFSELTLEELMNSELVCKRLSAIANIDAVWQRLFKKYFYIDITGPHCKEKFILFFTCLKAFKELPKELFTFDHVHAYGRKSALQDFIAAKSTNSDEIWLTFLQAISGLYFAKLEQEISGTISWEEYEEKVASCHSLLQRSCDLNNPFALQRLAKIEAVAVHRFKQAEVLLTRAHSLGSPDATYELALFYFNRYSSFKPHIAVPLHHDLMFQAARRGSSKAALHIGSTMYRCDLSFTTHIPFGDLEWETFNLIQKIAEKHADTTVDIEVLIDTDVPPLRKLATQGSALAAMYLSDIYLNTPRLSSLYKILSDKLYASALPARLERACYWLEEAAKDPKLKSEAERLLCLVNEARNISAKQTAQPSLKVSMIRR